MTRNRWPCIVVPSLSCLLTIAASAFAESWALWTDSRTAYSKHTTLLKVDREWDVVEAYSSGERECKNALALSIMSMMAGWTEHRVERNMETIETGSDWVRITFKRKDTDEVFKSNWNIRHVCLPATIDPRGPKGK